MSCIVPAAVEKSSARGVSQPLPAERHQLKRVSKHSPALERVRNAEGWEGEAPAEPRTTGGSRLGRSLALPFRTPFFAGLY